MRGFSTGNNIRKTSLDKRGISNEADRLIVESKD